MPLHEPETCPRCGALFACRPGDITVCQCSSMILTPELRSRIASEYEGCLCRTCLLELGGQIVEP